MNLKEYILNLQQRPVKERKRIAVIATAVSFFVIILIWIASFKEMNKQGEAQADPAAASLNDLKDNFETGKDSIQNMMNELPASPAGGPSQMGTAEADTTNGAKNSETSDNPIQDQENNSVENSQDNQNLPLLP